MSGHTITASIHELTVAPTGNVVVAYRGAVDVPEGAEARIEDAALVVLRGDGAPLRLTGLSGPDVAALRDAGVVLASRLAGGGAETVALTLAG